MRRQIVVNAATTVAQTISGAIALFFLYRFLVRAIGLERLGIWSLVLATTSVMTLANQGFSTGIIKFVAKYSAHDDERQRSLLMQTSALTLGLAAAAVSCALYPISRSILLLVLPRKSLPEALAILPLALVSLWLTILQGAVQAGLAGLQRITVCNYLEFSGSASYLALAYLLVPGHGLLGLAYAQVMQVAAILVVTWIVLRRHMKALPLIPCRWSRQHFRELAAYGFQFQLITASQALREPVTKALLAKFGGLALTGFYDLANRLVFTTRELLAQAGMVLIPAVSHLRERAPESIPRIYCEAYRLMFFLGVPSFTTVAVLSPVVSRIWIGRYEPAFVTFVCILAAGWLVNVLCNPAYVVALGTGALGWVSSGCVSTALINLGAGFLAGARFGAVVVVAVNALSLSIGYLILLSAHHIENRLPFSELLPRESAGVLAACAAGVLIFLPWLCRAIPAFGAFFPGISIAVAGMIALVATAMWFHPMRHRLIQWALSRVPA